MKEKRKEKGLKRLECHRQPDITSAGLHQTVIHGLSRITRLSSSTTANNEWSHRLVMGSSGQRTDPMEINGPAGQGITTADAFANYADDEPGDALPFYEAEGRILALWDQLNELKLEIALMEAQANPPAAALQHSDLSGENGPPNEETLNATLKEAERDCLEARAAYTLRQSVVESVLVTAPILKAVHAGSNPTPTER